MGVYLRSGKRCMPQQPAHGVEVGAAVEHIGGERVAKHVGRAPRCVDSVQGRVDDVVDRFAIHCASVGAREQFAVGTGAAGPHVDVVFNHLPEFCAKGDYSLLITLSEHF